MKVMMGTLMAGLVLMLTGCPAELPYYMTSYVVIFNPQKDLSVECPVLRVKMENSGNPDYIEDFDAYRDTSDFYNGYGRYDTYGSFERRSSDPFIPKIALQCVKNGRVVGESVRNRWPETGWGLATGTGVHISAPKANQVYVGAYASRTGVAPVIEIQAEITADWIEPRQN
ncbi:MAG: hypothetical protein U0Z75_07820 [Deinococcaceae bacterium]